MPTKSQILDWLDYYEDDDEIDLTHMERELAEWERERIEELEERQHNSGFYAFQDLMDMYRRER